MRTAVNATIEAYGQHIQVPFRYPVTFTRNVLDSDNSAIVDTLSASGSRPHRCLAYLDQGLAAAHPQIADALVAYARHHAEALQFYWKDEARVEQVKKDYRALDLPEKTRAMLDYAVTLTETPSAVTEADVEALRQAGFTDAAILDINLITSYFNFVNRIAEGLGVAFDPEEMTGYTY